MKANRAYELIVHREGIEPALFADSERSDRIEVVSIDDGEVILFWDLPAKDAARLLRELRADLAGLDVAEFLAAWQGRDGAAGSPP
jgi:hypothetical protein